VTFRFHSTSAATRISKATCSRSGSLMVCSPDHGSLLSPLSSPVPAPLRWDANHAVRHVRSERAHFFRYRPIKVTGSLLVGALVIIPLTRLT